MRIIFVGIHNKQGLQPLDSSTPSGKRIDAIIESFTGYNCIKANLFDLHYFPLGIDPKAKAEEFSNRMAISEGDIVVCLGKSVCDYLAKRLKCTVLKCPHPSPMTQIPKDAYTKDITNRLKNVMNPERGVATDDASSKNAD